MTDEERKAKRNAALRAKRAAARPPIVCLHCGQLSEVKNKTRKYCHRDECDRERRRVRSQKNNETRVATGAAAETFKAHRERNRARTPEQLAADQARLRPDGLQTCRKCRADLPLTEYPRNMARTAGVDDTCRACNDGAYRREGYAFIEERDNYLCTYCGEAPIDHIDHVVPRSIGGQDTARNLVGACITCNTSKGARELFDWRPELFDLVASWPCEVAAS